MRSPLGLPATRREGRKSAQRRPLAKTAFSLDWRSEFGETDDCQVDQFPRLCRICSPATGGVCCFWCCNLQNWLTTRRVRRIVRTVRQSDRASELGREDRDASRADFTEHCCKSAALRRSERFHTSRALRGIFDQGNFSACNSAARALSCPHGTGGDADDRQGNGAGAVDASALFASLMRRTPAPACCAASASLFCRSTRLLPKPESARSPQLG